MHSLDPLDTIRERTVGPHKLPVVNVRYQGHTIGLYGIREVGPKTVVLHPGPTSIPVGTQVLVEDLFGLIPGTHAIMVPATVIRDGGQRLTLSL